MNNQKVVFQVRLGPGREPDDLLIAMSSRKASLTPPAAFPITALVLCCDFFHMSVESSDGIFLSQPAASMALGRASLKARLSDEWGLSLCLARGHPST